MSPPKNKPKKQLKKQVKNAVKKQERKYHKSSSSRPTPKRKSYRKKGSLNVRAQYAAAIKDPFNSLAPHVGFGVLLPPKQCVAWGSATTTAPAGTNAGGIIIFAPQAGVLPSTTFTNILMYNVPVGAEGNAISLLGVGTPFSYVNQAAFPLTTFAAARIVAAGLRLSFRCPTGVTPPLLYSGLIRDSYNNFRTQSWSGLMAGPQCRPCYGQTMAFDQSLEQTFIPNDVDDYSLSPKTLSAGPAVTDDQTILVMLWADGTTSTSAASLHLQWISQLECVPATTGFSAQVDPISEPMQSSLMDVLPNPESALRSLSSMGVIKSGGMSIPKAVSNILAGLSAAASGSKLNLNMGRLPQNVNLPLPVGSPSTMGGVANEHNPGRLPEHPNNPKIGGLTFDAGEMKQHFREMPISHPPPKNYGAHDVHSDEPVFTGPDGRDMYYNGRNFQDTPGKVLSLPPDPVIYLSQEIQKLKLELEQLKNPETCTPVQVTEPDSEPDIAVVDPEDDALAGMSFKNLITGVIKRRSSTHK